ncbi:hypothetical protein BH10ACT3_BH10ACT3_04080 [soil metagenome]
MMMGEVRRLADGANVNGLAECRGQLMSLSQNNPLYSILGTTFGGDGIMTFALPNLPVDSGPAYYIALQGYYPQFE